MKTYFKSNKIITVLSVLFFTCSFSNTFAAFQLAGGGQAATTVCAGSTNVIIHYITFTGTPVATTGIGLTTTGTYVASTDITNFKLWVNTSNSLTGATLLATNSSPANAGAQTAFSFASRTPTTAEFYIITMDVQTTAVNNRTIAVSSTSNTMITPTNAANPNANTASGTQTISALTITTGTISGSPFCPGATVNVPFTVGACSFTGGNTFTAQLSDASGSFTSPTTIGTLSAVSSGTITATIPSTAAAGTGYRIRVIASTPAITGTNNGTNLTINSITITTGSITGSPFCAGTTVNVPFTVGTCSLLGGNTFTAQLSDAAGSFASPTAIGTLSAVSSGTITATIPPGAATGTGYRIRVVGSNPAITGSDNGTNLTVNPQTITTQPVSTPLCKGANVNIPFTVCGAFAGGNTFTAQLSDAAGSFASPTTIGTLSGTGSGVIAATIPGGATVGTGYLVRVVGSNPARTGTSNSNGNITISTPMTYSVSSVSQFTTSISKNCSMINSIIEIRVNVTGSCAPQTITQFNFNTASSSSPATDITKARVYYTGQTQGFTTSQQFGAELFAPAGAFTINGTQQLSFGAGTYYFYLAYEIPSTATAGNVVDASLTSFVIDGNTITDMSTPDPSGSSIITNGGTCSYTITKFPDLYFCGSNYTASAAQTVAFTLNESTAGSEFDKSQTNKTIVLKLPSGFAFDAAGSVSYTGSRDITAASLTAVVAGATSITVTITTDGSNTTQDNILFSGFKIYPTGPGSGDLVRTAGTFSVQGIASNPTSAQSFGHMSAGPPMAYQSSTAVQYDTTAIKKNCGNTTNGILEIQVNVTNPCEPITVTRFDFNTTGSTNPTTDITEAEIYYTGQTRGLNYNSWFGLTPNPNGAFSITGSQDLTLGAGTYYFYLVYDVPSTATVGDSLDASMTSFVIGGVTQTDMSTKTPTGARAISTGTCSPTSDVPNPTANNQTITAGSLVIPMDITHQNLYKQGATAVPFNIRAYGLVHSLLMNDIPVKWIIKSGKAKDAPDFVATASRVYPTTLAASTQTFVASAFVIDSHYVNYPFYPGGKTATQVITSFNAASPGKALAMVAVYSLTANVIADVRYTLTARPKIAVFSNGTNEVIHSSMLDSARITNYFVQNAGDFQGLASCYTFCSEAHWDYTPGDPVKGNLAPVQNVLDFVNEGGNFLAQCAGIDLYENHQPQGGHFHTTQGIDFANAALSANTDYNVDMALNQYQGSINPRNASAIGIFWPKTSSSYKPETYNSLADNPITPTVVATAAHLSDPDSIGSNVFYLGGHNYGPAGGNSPANASTTLGWINGVRLYLNATLIPAKRPSAFQANMNPNTTICIGQSVTLGGSPTGPAGAIYTWTPCDGSLDNCNSPNPVATPSVTTTYFVYINNNGCPGTGQVTITVVPKPTASITAVSSRTVCANNANITLTGSVTNATGGTWTSSGTGTFSPNNVTLPTVTYTPSNADIVAGRVTFTLTSTGNNAPCTAATNTVTVIITPAPTANAGNDTTVCASNRNVAIKGNVTVAGGGRWSSNGTGTFSPNANTLNTTYVISDADTAAHSVKLVLTTTLNGACNAVTDTMVIFITPEPKATVGAVKSVTVCANAPVMLTTTTVTNGTGAWTSSGGGIFNPNNTAAATSYSLSAADIVSGTATLTLTATGNGACSTTQAQDILSVTITPLPTSSVGTVKTATVCANAPVMLTSSTVTNGTGIWTSSGGGVFNPNNTAAATSYSLSATDIASGIATLTLTATGNGVCGTTKVQDILTVTITPLPTSSVGTVKTTTVCANAPVMLTSTTVTNGTGIWTSNGGGVFDPDSTSSATTYSLSIADTTAGTITLTLTVTGNGVCGTTQVQDILTVNITPEPIANVSVPSPEATCANNRQIDLSSRVVYNGTRAWTSSGGTGVFNLSPDQYVLSDADTTAHTVDLYLTVTGSGACGSVQAKDTLIVNITPEPHAILLMGSDTSVCANVYDVPIHGKVINATGRWSTYDGTGLFLPDTTMSAITYSLSLADTSARIVHLVINAKGLGVCGTTIAKDTLTIRTSPPPTVSVGATGSLTVCTNNPQVQLNGSVLGATGIIWSTTNGTGTFSPDATTGNALYTLSNEDTSQVFITLNITSTGNGACNPVNKPLQIVLKKAPRPDFTDSSVCKNLVSPFFDKSIVPAPPYTSVWKFGDGVMSSTPSHTYATDGIYTATLVITDNNNCVDSISKSIAVYPLPVASFTNTANCFRSAVYFTDKSTVNTLVTSNTIAAWDWNFGDGGTSTLQNPSHVFPVAGAYTSTLIAYSDHNCSSAPTPITFTVTPAPVAKFSTDSVCLNKTTQFTDLSTTNGIIPPGLQYWDLDFGDATTHTSSLPTIHTYATPGPHFATLIIQAQNLCYDTITDTVIVHPLPQVSFTSSTFCSADSTHFLSTSTISTGSIKAWAWDFGDGTTASGSKAAHKYPHLGTTSNVTFGVTLKNTSVYNCEASNSAIITIHPSPKASFTVDKDIVELHKTVQFNNTSTGADSLSRWSFGDTATATSAAKNPSYKYDTKAGTFTTKLVVTNIYNCSDSTTKDIIVKLPPKVPNVFTPNGDGSNDVLYVLGGPYKDLEFRVLNNWGEFIFYSNSQSLGWDGTKNGVKQPIGVYVYTISATTEDGERHTLYGDVTLLR